MNRFLSAFRRYFNGDDINGDYTPAQKATIVSSRRLAGTIQAGFATLFLLGLCITFLLAVDTEFPHVYLNEPFPIAEGYDEVVAGDQVAYLADFCRNTDEPLEIHFTLTDL